MIKEVYISFILLIFLTTLSSAGSIGITPAYYREHFEPNLEKTFEFTARTSNPNGTIKIVPEGPLSEYISLNSSTAKSGEKFKVNLKLPAHVDTPGTNIIILRISEFTNDSEKGLIGTQVEMKVPISIKVPYPGLYIESQFEIKDQNEKEQATYKLNIQNLGSQDTTVRPKIEIFKEDKNGEKVLTKKLDEIPMKTKKEISILDKLSTEELPAGDYYVSVAIDYGPEGKVLFLNDTFRIGEFLVDIIDYSYEFEENGIRPFNITIENKWNSKIDSIHAEVSITQEGKVVRTFKTVSIDTGPWEVKNLLGYFDTNNLTTGRYLANMKVYYGDAMSHKLVAVYVTKTPTEKNYKKQIIIGLSIGAFIILLIMTYLIVKVYKLKKALKSNRKNEKKTERKKS